MKIIDIPRSGSYADKTSSRNRAGQYVRNRRSPVQPVGTGRRAFIREAFGSCSQYWSSITDAQRASWDAFTAGYPYTDSLGQTVILTGHQMFVAINTQRVNCELGISATPPPSVATAGLSPASFTADAITGLSITWPGADPNGLVLLAFSPPLSPGRSFPPSFWQAAVVAGDSTPATPTAAYVAEFGALVTGRKIFCKMTPVNEYGVTGASLIISAVVTP